LGFNSLKPLSSLGPSPASSPVRVNPLIEKIMLFENFFEIALRGIVSVKEDLGLTL